MKNNPFITVILLFAVQIMAYVYIDYMNFQSFNKGDLGFILFCFTIPVICLFMLLFLKNSRYRKSFRNFSIFLMIAAIIVFAALSYLSALGKAYQH
ncbi:hypothetical protein [Chryseobacterium sp. JUb7]|uniref:hypothetical protein n=1 Tax=Chryseobacterium sp. JUb7 TaxID=2940599 RepID=UPI002168C249|nr:hypothetical protein [Chryseobacterium sp. JUb7]MCS3532945.1 multisubunit Na+/H+ antiporter MnhB subunit [Chryseobacterium sp. JUb7]